MVFLLWILTLKKLLKPDILNKQNTRKKRMIDLENMPLEVQKPALEIILQLEIIQTAAFLAEDVKTDMAKALNNACIEGLITQEQREAAPAFNLDALIHDAVLGKLEEPFKTSIPFEDGEETEQDFNAKAPRTKSAGKFQELFTEQDYDLF